MLVNVQERARKKQVYRKQRAHLLTINQIADRQKARVYSKKTPSILSAVLKCDWIYSTVLPSIGTCLRIFPIIKYKQRLLSEDTLVLLWGQD